MSGNNQKKIQNCIYCDAEVKPDEVYCPECGKLNIELKSSKETIKKEQTDEIERVCPGCSSIIASIKLQQCPICNTILEKLPENLKTSSQETVGYIFDLNKSKKLQPIIQKENWNLKEGIQVFEFTIILYFIVITTIYLFFWHAGTDFEVNIFTILLTLIPYSLLSLYPIYYIIGKKNKFMKLGFNSDSKLNFFAILIGIFGGITLYVLEFIFTLLFDSFVALGFQGFMIYNENALQTQNVIKNSGFWIFLYLLLILLSAFSIEITYRGVLHNSLKEKFNKTTYDNIYVILIVALIYAGIESLFMTFIDFYVSLFFFLLNFLTFSIIGILFEINGNIYNSLVANVMFNILVFITIFYF